MGMSKETDEIREFEKKEIHEFEKKPMDETC